MTLTRIQALVIAAGLAIVGVAVARADTDPSPPSAPLEGGIFAEGYAARDGRPAGDWRPRTPQDSARPVASSPL